MTKPGYDKDYDENGPRSKNNILDRGRSLARKRLRVRSHYARELMAEFIGTAFLVAMGETAGASQILSKGTAGDVITSNIGWGVGVFLAIYMAKDISGGLFNPAITVTWGFLGKLEWRKVIPYCFAEVAGGFAGAAIVHAVYYDAINAFDGFNCRSIGPNGTAAIFATYPKDHLSVCGAVADQVFGTCFLVIAVLIAIHPKNGLPPHLMPFAVGIYVMSNGFTFAYNAAGGINPARDLGPRLWTLVAGWGKPVFSYWNYGWFWIPTACPFVGAILGALVYNLFVGLHSDADDEEEQGIPMNTGASTSGSPAFLEVYTLNGRSSSILGRDLSTQDSMATLVR